MSDFPKGTVFDNRGNRVVFVRPRRAASYAPGGYEAAGFSTERSFIHGSLLDSMHEHTPFTRNEIARLAVWLWKNVGMVRGLGWDFVKYIVGPGIFPFSDSGDGAWDELADDYFEEWAKIQDAGGRWTQWDKQRMRCLGKFLVGEFFTLLTASPGGYPQTQILRAHNCGEFGDDRYRDGIKLGRANFPAAYRFRTGPDKFQNVPGNAVVHSYHGLLGDEVRQVSTLAAAINDIRDVMETLGFEKGSIKDLSRTARVITKSPELWDEEEQGEGEDFYKDSTTSELRQSGIAVEKIYGREIAELDIGEKLEAFQSDRPGSTFLGFLDHVGKAVYASTGWRWEFSWNPSGISGPGQRVILDSIEKTIALWQASEIRDTGRERSYVIAAAMARGDLPYNEKWWRAEYVAGASKPSIDRGREGRMDLDMLRAGADNYRELYGRRGKHWKRSLTQWASEQAYIRDLEREYGFAAGELRNGVLDNPGAKTNGGTQQQDPQNDEQNNPGESQDGWSDDRVDAYGVGVRAGLVTPQESDEESYRAQVGLPLMSAAAREAWKKDGGVRRPITLAGSEVAALEQNNIEE